MNNQTIARYPRYAKQLAAALTLSALVAAVFAATTNTPSATQSLSALSTDSTVQATAKAFLATLDASQQQQVLLELTVQKATAWSNLPCGSQCRPGIRLDTLSDTQKTAALAILQTALSDSKEGGFEQVTQLFKADSYLNTLQGGGMQGASFGSNGAASTNGFRQGMGGPRGGGGGGGFTYGDYYLAFLGTPDRNGTWQLHFGGHHLAINITYRDGKVISTTPEFVGIEPTSWTEADHTYAPMAEEHQHMTTLLASLSDEQLATAKLSGRFNDVLLGPQQDGRFPTTKEGLPVSDMNSQQRQLLIEAIKPWVQDVDSTTAAALMKIYTAEINDTYIAYSGTPSLSSHADYVRIDGPSVWIELVCQSGVIIPNQIHYHSVWRDHQRDYGAVFDF